LDDESVRQRILSSDPALLRDALEDNLVAHPKETAELLLVIHAALKPDSTASSWNQDHYKRQFGLTRGPGETSSEIIAAEFREIQRAAGSSLAKRGRPPEGLYDLIEGYIVAADGRMHDPAELEHARRRLMTGLLHFSEKLLFVANHEVLMQSSGQPVNAPRSGSTPSSRPVSRRNEIEIYVRVLQAVGNRIQVQANELITRADHGLWQEDQADAEKQAIRIAYGKSPESLYADLTNAVASAEPAYRKPDAEHAKSIADLKASLAKSQVVSLTSAHDNAKSKLTQAESAQKAAAETLASIDAVVEIVRGQDVGDASAKDLKTALNAAGGLLPAPVGPRLAAMLETHAPKSDETANAYQARLLAVLSTERATQEAARSAQEKAAEKLTQDAAEAKIKLTEAEAKDADQKKALGAAEATRKRANEVRSALGELDRLRAKVLERLRGIDGTVTPALVKSETLRVVRAESPDPVRGSTLQWVEAYQAASDKLIIADSEAPTNAAVIDEVIAALRQEQILLTQEAGPESEAVKRVEAALDVAYEQRSGMVYIRPASAYLRTSYPATMLQNSPNIAWQNLLFRHSLRAIPLFGEPMTNPPRRLVQIQEEIDKQYWQTINQVRVAGGGRTNYVLAQDDIGNWYVKNYSANPEPIIRSAVNLAMFNLGATMGADLVGEMADAAADLGGAKNARQELKAETRMALARGPLHAIHSRHLQQYNEKTAADLATAKSLLDAKGLSVAVADAWNTVEYLAEMPAYRKSLGEALDLAGKNHLQSALNAINKDEAENRSKAAKAIDSAKKASSDPATTVGLQLAEAALEKAEQKEKAGQLASRDGDHILAAMHAMRAFQKDLAARIAAVEPKELVEARTKLEEEKNKLAAEQRKLDDITADLAALEAQRAAGDDAVPQADIDAKRAARDAQAAVVDDAEARVETASTAHTRAAAGPQSAQEEARKAVISRLRPLLDARLETVRFYEQAVLFMGDGMAN
jgi:hypothetical protein